MDPLDQKRNGYALRDVAEIMNRMSVLKTEHGEPGYQEPFQQFLRSKGLTENGWAEVWNDWHQTMENDPSLGAKFHTYMGQVRQREMMAKQPDVSGEAFEGVTLAAYAKISAQIQTGAAPEQIVAGEGLTMEQWQKGQAAWVDKMGKCSPTDPILIQYGQLYQKWAPNHQAMMEAGTEAALADAARQQGRGDGMSKEVTQDNFDEFIGHDDIRVRVRGVREMIRIWELGWDDRDDRMRQQTQRAYDEGVKVLNEGSGQQGLMALTEPVDAMDIHQWSAMIEEEQTQQGAPDMVYGPLKDLAGEKFMTPQQSEAAQAAIRKALERIAPRAEKVQAAFDEATDELKRTQLRQLIDDYRETLSDMQEALDDWDHTGPEEGSGAAMPSAASSASASSSASVAASSSALSTSDGGGFLAVLKRLPIIGQLLRLLGL